MKNMGQWVAKLIAQSENKPQLYHMYILWDILYTLLPNWQWRAISDPGKSNHLNVFWHLSYIGYLQTLEYDK